MNATVRTPRASNRSSGQIIFERAHRVNVGDLGWCLLCPVYRALLSCFLFPNQPRCVPYACSRGNRGRHSNNRRCWGAVYRCGGGPEGGGPLRPNNASVKAVRLRQRSKTKHLLPSLPLSFCLFTVSVCLCLSVCLYATMSDLHELNVTQTIWPCANVCVYVCINKRMCACVYVDVQVNMRVEHHGRHTRSRTHTYILVCMHACI